MCLTEDIRHKTNEQRHEKNNVLVSDQAVQLQKVDRGLKFWNKKVEGLYYVKCLFSHDAAQI